MESSTHVSPTSSNRSSYSCVRCAKRKVKCDRQSPCSACVKHNTQCVFRPPPPPRRRPKRVKGDRVDGNLKHNDTSLRDQSHDQDRTQNITGSQQYRSSGRSEKAVSGNDSQLPTPESTGFGPDQSITKTQLIHGRGGAKFVDNGLWTRVAEEFQDPEEAFEDSPSDSSDAEANEEELGFVMGIASTPKMSYVHPPAEQISQLWQIFVENIDPLTKVVHAPTLQLAVQKATNDIESVSRSLEALMFAIYSTAVLSLKNDECKTRFGESRKILLSRYITATKAALSRAKFMGTTSIVVLQALVLHLISVRDVYEPRALWTLSGVAVRLAEAMGLHRDGASLGLSPFETEVRRRLWWQLKMNDFRTAELGGLAKFRGAEHDLTTTNPPANVNDDELYPSMSSPPVESARPTDAIFCILRSQLGIFAANYGAKFQLSRTDDPITDDLASHINTEEKTEFVNEIEEKIETKCLRYCDPSHPLQLMTMIVGRTAVDVGSFMMHHPRRWASREQVPESERQFVWDISIRMLERQEMLQSNYQLQRFAWHATYFLQWHAFIHVLDTIRANPLMPAAPRAWKCIQSIYESHLKNVSNSRRTIHRAVSNLCLKEYNAREAALINAGFEIPETPEYIIKLREQREATLARIKTRAVKNKRKEAIDDYNPSRAGAGEMPQRVNFERQTMPPPMTNINQSGGIADNDQSWHNTGFDDGLLSSSSGLMNIDAESMMAQDYNLGDTSDQPINWAQWDAWLGDSSMLQANLSTSFEDLWQNI